MSNIQKALLVTEIGQPVVLVTDRAIPEPSENEVQVKVSVAGINPHDRLSRDLGLFISENLPAILTNDVVGRVTKLGPGVTDVAVGDRVVYQPGFAPAGQFGSKQNGLQEYAIADRIALTKVPDFITDDEAATLPTNVVASLAALFVALKIPAPWTDDAEKFDYAGTTVLIIGGGSNCGRFGVQLAKLAGIGRIVVVGGDETELKGFGATDVLDRHGGDDAILSRIREEVGDDLIYAYDAINPPTRQALALNSLSSTKRGALARLVSMGPPVDESKVLEKQAGYDLRNVFGSSHVYPDLIKAFWDRLPGFLETGKIKPLGYVVKRGLTPENVNEVLDAYRDGKRVTKTHIHL